uniref:Uncharacterized protein n=1 Tax=Arion vulgaris TaxID=1028688 RepID=A0A0B7AT58_9EUPU
MRNIWHATCQKYCTEYEFCSSGNSLSVLWKKYTSEQNDKVTTFKPTTFSMQCNSLARDLLHSILIDTRINSIVINVINRPLLDIYIWNLTMSDQKV